jgi:hypothetical protein
MRRADPGLYLVQSLGPENVERQVVALDSGLDALALGVASRWWQLESYLRQLVYIELRAMYGVTWHLKLGSSPAKRSASTTVLGYMASADDSYLITHLGVSELFQLIDSEWAICNAGIGMPAAIWAGRVQELLAIRHRMAHGRRPHLSDPLRIEQTLRDLEGPAHDSLFSYASCVEVDPAWNDPVIDAWIKRQHPLARLIDHGQRNKGIHFDLLYSVRTWSNQFPPLSNTPGGYWAMHVIFEDRHLQLQPFCTSSAVQTSGPWIGHIISDGPTRLLVTFPTRDGPEDIAEAIGRCFEATFINSRPREATEREVRFRRHPPYDSRIDVDGILSVLSSLNQDDPITLFSA